MDRYTLINNEKIDNTNLLATSEIIEKKSKFISYIYKINNENDAIKYINKIKDKNREARHVVYIYTYLNNNIVNFRFSDDGEPKGTGTKAIYELLEKECITNICIIIVRYFGGILLGAGPLSRTYLNSARESILKCEKKKLYNYIEFKTNLSYQKFQTIKSKIEKYILDEDILDFSTNFTDIVTIDCYIKEENSIKIKSLFN